MEKQNVKDVFDGMKSWFAKNFERFCVFSEEKVMFEIIEKDEEFGTVIKVFGVGGAGGNAIEHMIQEGSAGRVHRRQYRCAGAGRNTAASNRRSATTGPARAPNREAGQAAAAHRDEIRESLKARTWPSSPPAWAANRRRPVVAEIAREMGILTVGGRDQAVQFRGNKRMRPPRRESPVAPARRFADRHPQRRLMEVMGDDAMLNSVSRRPTTTLKNAVGGIAEIITYPAWSTSTSGRKKKNGDGAKWARMMGSARRASTARHRCRAAVASPPLEGVNLQEPRVCWEHHRSQERPADEGSQWRMNTVKAFAAEDAHHHLRRGFTTR